ncbi:MAG: MOSC domain-containing protein [Afipia sp.]|nr:MOSC domain-containing protein [Afipia sp.]
MPNDSSAKIASIYRYPVKGLSPEQLPSVTLTPGQTLPSDRRYAIENGPSKFDPDNPKYLPKAYFLMLMRNERLAGLQTHFDDTTNVFTVRHNSREVASGDLETADGRAAVEDYFRQEFASDLKGAPKILTAPGHSFSDVSAKVVSIINLDSVAAIEQAAGQPIDPLRFRGNLYVDGWPGWHEFSLLGETLAIGDVKLKVKKSIVRCAAINVDPVTAERDMNLLKTMVRHFGHDDCGVYAEVVSGGTISAGDKIEIVSPELRL